MTEIDVAVIQGRHVEGHRGAAGLQESTGDGNDATNFLTH
jgi:hypothetical protein